jgi:cell division protein FtsZ
MLNFEMERNQSSIIKVIGVGGGGSNAVNHMFRSGITGVDFIVCNTDSQALESSPVPVRIQLGRNLTQGLGAGSVPEIGRKSAEESIEEMRSTLEGGTRMVFITAGMGGGTGTGAAPVIAAMAREMGLLTVGIISIPFTFEGLKRKRQAEQGILEMRRHVDTLLIISNEKVRELHGNLRMTEALGKADDILTTAAKGIAEIITVPGYINVDFEDIRTVMKGSGVAIMGTGIAEGENRAYKAVEMALQSPLLNDSEIKGASNVLLNVISGEDEVRMDEVEEITAFIQQAAGVNTDIIWGNSTDTSLGKAISVTVIATGFNARNPEFNGKQAMEGIIPPKTIHVLDDGHPVKPAAFPDIKPGQDMQSIKERSSSSVVDVETGLFDFELKTSNPFDVAPDEEPMEQAMNMELEIVEPEAGVEAHVEEEAVESQVLASIPASQPIVMNENRIAAPAHGQNSRSEGRINKLREMSMKLKSPGGLQELENQPAYMRKNVKLADTPGSEEPHVSRYTLDGDGNSRSTDINTNNSYLHDNVD